MGVMGVCSVLGIIKAIRGGCPGKVSLQFWQ